MHDIPERQGFFARLGAILRQRCPRCFTGKVFKSLFVMNEPCPHCGQIFQREEGYFLGAMYVSYALGCGVVGVAYLVLRAVVGEVTLTTALWLFAAYVPFIPLIFRYSRVTWMHLDYLVSPNNTGAGVYEKVRQEALTHSAATSPETPAGRTPAG